MCPCVSFHQISINSTKLCPRQQQRCLETFTISQTPLAECEKGNRVQTNLLRLDIKDKHAPSWGQQIPTIPSEPEGTIVLRH